MWGAWLWATMAFGASFNVLEDGTVVRWQPRGEESRPHIPVVVNPANVVGVPGFDVERAVVEALTAWQAATNGAFTFDVYVGTTPAFYPSVTEPDGYTTIHFASRDPGAALPASRAGFTELVFDQQTGAILEGDIVINDIHYAFTSKRRATNYSDEGFFGKTLLLSDVVTHEVGHLLGLSHTGVGPSSMFPGIWSGLDSLACDDVLGIRELYSPSQGAVITGTIDVEDAREWAGVEVMAISHSRRAVVAATFTDADGNFRLTGLSSDKYMLMAGPYLGSAEDLPIPLNENFRLPCAVSRGFSEPFDLSSGEERQMDMALPCDGGVDLPTLPGTRKFPLDISVDEDGRFLQAFRIDPGFEDSWFRIAAADGALSFDVLSYSLFSAGRVDVAVTDVDGIAMFYEIEYPLVASDDTPVWDARVRTFGQDADLLLQMRSALLPPEAFPAAGAFVDSRSFAVIVGSLGDVWEEPLSCEPEARPTYVSPGGLPVKSWNPPSAKGGGCATGAPPSSGFVLVALGLVGALRRQRP